MFEIAFYGEDCRDNSCSHPDQLTDQIDRVHCYPPFPREYGKRNKTEETECRSLRRSKNTFGGSQPPSLHPWRQRLRASASLLYRIWQDLSRLSKRKIGIFGKLRDKNDCLLSVVGTNDGGFFFFMWIFRGDFPKTGWSGRKYCEIYCNSPLIVV